MNGAYNNAVLGGADPADLQQIRNAFGPSWLVTFSLAKVSVDLDYTRLKYWQMAEIVDQIAKEIQARNPIRVNLYVHAIYQARDLIREISNGEAGNFTSESGPREA